MRTDHQTHPIAPAATDQYERWPAINDLENPDAAGPSTKTWLDKHRDDGPLPALGGGWNTGATPRPQPSAPTVMPYSYLPASGHRRTARLATASVVTGCVAAPLVVLGGIGGILGILAVVLGVVSIRQIDHSPELYGKVRAVVGIVAGAGSALVGIPILLLLLLILGA